MRVSIRKILDVVLHNALSNFREKYAIWQLLTNILLVYWGKSRIFSVDNEDNKKRE